MSEDVDSNRSDHGDRTDLPQKESACMSTYLIVPVATLRQLCGNSVATLRQLCGNSAATLLQTTAIDHDIDNDIDNDSGQRDWGVCEDDGGNEGGEDSRAMERTRVGRERGWKRGV